MAQNQLAALLRDFAQGASNSAASTVSAPVDGIAWLLRKAGVPIPAEPVGGSDWMARQGLTAQPTNALAGGAGEFAGMVAPMVAAAKAPQIANALVRMGENARAPATMNPQMGAIVFHGSPHKFDKFDSRKIGTGEGAQAYGHGLYLAEAPEVARTYRSAGADPSTFTPVRSIRDPAQMAATALERAGGDIRHATAVLAQNAQSGDITAGAALELLKKRAALPESQYAGHLYKVDLPDEQIARMLDWDKPLSQQAPGVREALAADKRAKDSLYQNGGEYYRALMARHAQNAPPHMSLDAAEVAAQSPASQQLRALGIPGIRYLDGGSRGAGQGTSNFVAFPGTENMLTILERNGRPVR